MTDVRVILKTLLYIKYFVDDGICINYFVDDSICFVLKHLCIFTLWMLAF